MNMKRAFAHIFRRMSAITSVDKRRLIHLERENKALWKEVAELNGKIMRMKNV